MSAPNRNQRIMNQYHELIRQQGACGHYETVFRIVAGALAEHSGPLIAALQELHRIVNREVGHRPEIAAALRAARIAITAAKADLEE